MGIFRVDIKVGNPNGGELKLLDAMVDTGATDAMIPASVLVGLGVKAKDEPETFELADNSTMDFPVGTARLIVEGRDRDCPVIFGPEGQALLGATSLEILGFGVDPIGQELIPLRRRIRPI